MKTVLVMISSFCTLLLVTPRMTAQTATGTFDATGQVIFSNVSAGPFASIQVGDPAQLLLEVAVPGVPVAPGQFENYLIDTTVSTLDVGGVIGQFSGSPAIALQNDFPVADGVHLFTTPLTDPGHAMEFELWDGTGGNIFGSTDYEDEIGSYGPGLFQAIAWTLFTPSGQISMSLTDLTLRPVAGWLDRGNGLAGSGGRTPELRGQGDMIAGQTVTLTVGNALPNAKAFLVIGLSALNLPFKGGIMVPGLDFISVQTMRAQGNQQLSGPWPPGVPSGFTTWYQFWILDPVGPKGFSASNALQGGTP